MNDPYIGGITEDFKKEYQRVFNRKPFLSNPIRTKLLEIASIEPDFKDNLKTLLEKYKSLEFQFKERNVKPGLNWLILGDNWMDLLNGVYDNTKSVGFWDSLMGGDK